ncbi:hypothetical protein BSIN_1959 [Burkholderia singularis]|uniref:Uncharacterized protein n=1 Tax=Burkholderia singularis TaxID=1503053 RepID=A0A238H0B8_9BURK|nr:hypothetical protein BSIN_1959 [Burkholderia singularis]
MHPRCGNAHSNSNSQQKRARRPFDGAPPFSCSCGHPTGNRLVHPACQPNPAQCKPAM